MFCPKCGSILLPRKKELICPRCSYKAKGEKGRAIKEKIGKEKKVEVIEKEEAEHLPITTDVVCPKCGAKEAYHWEIQTRASDEPATRFFKCKKCKHIWREYD